jgi:microcompartment protein CcmK/EutM
MKMIRGVACRPAQRKHMKNAHERLARVRYVDQVGNARSNVEVYCDRVMADENKTHLLSIFGTDAAVSAIMGALYDERPIHLLLPGGEERSIGMGDHLLVSTGNIRVPGQRFALKHKVILSSDMKENGLSGFTYLMNTSEPALGWGLVCDKLGLPSLPEWSEHMMMKLSQEDRLVPLFGFNCNPAVVQGTREEFLEWIGQGVRDGFLQFPDVNIPLQWPQFKESEALHPNLSGILELD